ncbi:MULTISPECIES: PadR family transcriptional regulator [unclassified Duganella]|jgi:DNA-binding PadR family transcriptional regulator|uniref:PadR family transcriptional regulator n=1 Tax=unclassified Duganella TaxID=2636909 RepID=UPI000886C84D|nr:MULTISPECIES: PadR family transcriptional regulator [unclassified Duganella]SDF97268.1 DNA-binding transcriptional regulator, PadR family [Duganella sp. OV458]SDJ07417.1 transcriptional regulator, PadR family [Duganella sp. OV510]
MFHRHHHHHPHGPHGHHPHPGGHGPRGRGPKMFDAGAMRYVVLQLIAEKPRHGYEIIKELEQRSGGGYTPSPGAIYPLLSMLLDMGHVVATPDGNKKLHTITPEGEAFLAENRQFVDAILARLADPDEHREGLRSAMHDLKHAAIEQARASNHHPERIEQIRAILRKAVEEINAL